MIKKVEQWRVCEIPLESKAAYSNPFLDVDVRADFMGPSGKTITLLGFWDGGNNWKVRFAPTEIGIWRYHVYATNTADEGLNNIEGSIECIPYGGSLDIYKHGFLKVGPRGRYLVYNDNTPFFWLGDTHWTFVTEERLDESNCPKYESQFKACVDKRAQQKFNVYQCNFRDGKDAGLFGKYKEYLLDTESGLLPNIEFIKSNPDPKIAYIADKGFVIAAGFSWFDAILSEGALKRYKLLAKYLVARYGAYPIIWTLAGEIPGYFGGEMEEEITKKWREVALTVEECDGYGALQSVHLATDRPFPQVYQGESWYDFTMSQAGHGDLPVNASMYSGYRRMYPSVPLVESESLYEGINSLEDNGSRIVTPEMLRRVAYLCIQNGGCGYTYGACGVWELQWEAAKPGDFWYSWGSMAWYDGLELPGANELTIMRDFYENIGWYNLEPIPEIISMDFKMKNRELNARNFPSYIGDKDMRTIVGYYPPSCNRSVTIKTLSGNRYRAQWFDPSNGHYTTIDEDVRPVNGCWTAPRKTSMADAVLVLTAK
jgi:hypothetical protein